MITAYPGSSFEATADWGTAGLVGLLTVAVYDNVGGTTIAPHVGSIVEVTSGIYVATMTAPSSAGQYSIVFSYGGEDAVDDLMVTTAVSLPIVPTGQACLLTVGNLVDEIVLDRFEIEHRPRALKALNNRLAHLWGLEDWTWKFARVPLYTSAQVEAVGGYPADFGVPLYLWDDTNCPLPYMEIGPFHASYKGIVGQPAAWTVINQQILLGPTPYHAATFWTYYRKRLLPICNEDEVPQLPAEFQLALVHGGRAELLAFYNDPTADQMEQQWQMDIEALRREYLADATGQPDMWPSDMESLVGYSN